VAQVGRERAREVLETSFAQFQADRAVVGLARQVRTHEEALDGYAEAMTCHLGDFAEYADLRRQIKDREAQQSRRRQGDQRAEAAQSLEKLRIGDVIEVPAGRRSGWAVVLEPDSAVGMDGPRPTVLTADRQVRRLSVVDVPQPVEAFTRMRVPKGFNARSPQARRDLASTLRGAIADAEPAGARVSRRGRGDDAALIELRRQLRAHPCHGCAEREDHARWSERWWRLRREADALKARIEGRTNTVARTFDRVCDVLTDLGYLRIVEGRTRVTHDGARLRRLYTELDLLTAECLRSGVWKGLDGVGLAACLSALVHESRREDGPTPRLPGGQVGTALDATLRLWAELEEREGEHGLSTQRRPDTGLAWAMQRWARGDGLDSVLRETDLAAGDFVRRCKQLVDLLGQVAVSSDDASVRRAALDAVDLVLRGVVAHSSVA
jgi:ATP-dependent RNA helicase HelY